MESAATAANEVMQTQTLIIGAGLSGLALAARLNAVGHDFLLVEARSRTGGRILTEQFGAGAFDLGPTWFWPGQPRIAALMASFGLKETEQHYAGELSFEDASGHVQRGKGFASMQGSFRVQGGMAALTDGLMARLPATRVMLSTQIAALSQSADGITATTQSGQQIDARRVVLALPPRIAGSITYAPDLPASAHTAMDGIATWMAGQAKVVVTYDRPFWREAGLSGDAMSQRGPLAEVHDASPAQGGPYALFGFLGIPPQARQDHDHLWSAVLQQLTRLFGPQAGQPTQRYIKDWAFDPFTATAADQKPLYAHPTYGLPAALDGLWDGRLIFGGTEVAAQFGGYLEGAIEAAEQTFDRIKAAKA